jgi:hypothetical protein
VQALSAYRTVNKLIIRHNTDLLILYREMIADSTAIHTEHINSICVENVKFLNVKRSCMLDFKMFKKYRMRLWAELL